MIVMISTAIWYEGRKGFIQSCGGKKWWQDRNSYGVLICRVFSSWQVLACSCLWTCAHGSCMALQWVCLHVCVCAHSAAPGGNSMWAAARPTLSSLCGSLARALWLLLEGWVPWVEEWEFFSQAIKDLAKMVSKPACWHKLDWRAQTTPFSSGPWIAVQDKTVTHQPDTIATCPFDILKHYWKVFF